MTAAVKCQFLMPEITLNNFSGHDSLNIYTKKRVQCTQMHSFYSPKKRREMIVADDGDDYQKVPSFFSVMEFFFSLYFEPVTL